MIQNYNNYRILKIFLDDPLNGFSLREISRTLKLGLPSVSNYIKQLEKEQLIIKKDIYGKKLWFGKRESNQFKIYKKFDTIRVINESGLIQYLDATLNIPTIILYGSHTLGEDRKESDIDLFIITPSKNKIEVEKFEKIIGKKLHIIINNEQELEKLNKEMKNNLINGIVLSGYFKLLK
jgi:predicted nucleotidyltransferase|tara:strand:+ start:2252 stop:2788 length:537 start_codon:yes stop_codon:yes gene_type:complete